MNLSTRLSPQSAKILDHLKIAGSISNVEAHAVHRCRSLSRRITEIVRALRGTGYRIDKKTQRDVTGQRYTRYYFVREAT